MVDEHQVEKFMKYVDKTFSHYSYNRQARWEAIKYHWSPQTLSSILSKLEDLYKI